MVIVYFWVVNNLSHVISHVLVASSTPSLMAIFSVHVEETHAGVTFSETTETNRSVAHVCRTYAEFVG